VFYFVLTFVFSWMVWMLPLLASRGFLSMSGAMQMSGVVVGSFGPFVAAWVSLYRDGGWPAMRDFAKRCWRYRIGWIYLLAALLLVPLIGLGAASVHARWGGPALALAMPLGQIPLMFLVLFFVGGSVNEEFGWAYAIERLQARHRWLSAAVILGVIWGFWHLPLFFIVGGSQSFMPFWAFLMFTIGARVLFVWAYAGTGKSMLVTLLFHTTANLTLNLFALIDRSPQRDERGFIAFACLTLAAAAIVAFASRRYRNALAPLVDHSA
jgi:membrane protease YdiL (CAAX protease family)